MIVAKLLENHRSGLKEMLNLLWASVTVLTIETAHFVIRQLSARGSTLDVTWSSAVTAPRIDRGGVQAMRSDPRRPAGGRRLSDAAGPQDELPLSPSTFRMPGYEPDNP